MPGPWESQLQTGTPSSPELLPAVSLSHSPWLVLGLLPPVPHRGAGDGGGRGETDTSNGTHPSSSPGSWAAMWTREVKEN